MIKILTISIVSVFFLGCATTEEARVNKPVNLKTIEKIVVKEVLPKDVVRVNNLVWETSDNYNSIKNNPINKLFFDLGLAYQLGVYDGLNGRKLTKEERIGMYPLFNEYLTKDKVGLVDLNTSYEGGYNAAITYIRSQDSKK